MSPTTGMILIGILLVVGMLPFLAILLVNKPKYEKKIGRKMSINEIFSYRYKDKEQLREKADYRMSFITITLIMLVMIYFLWFFAPLFF